jgi:hypothetical protein
MEAQSPLRGMSVRKADDFIADVERQFDWYLAKAVCADADPPFMESQYDPPHGRRRFPTLTE